MLNASVALDELLLHEATASRSSSKRKGVVLLSVVLSVGFVALQCADGPGRQNVLPISMAMQLASAPGFLSSQWRAALGSVGAYTHQHGSRSIQVMASRSSIASQRAKKLELERQMLERSAVAIEKKVDELDSRTASPQAISRIQQQQQATPSLYPKFSSPSYQENLEEYVTTSAGVQMPRVIYTSSFKKDRTSDLVLRAVRNGFRGFDASSGQGARSSAVGDAFMWMQGLGIERSSLFIQTKITPKAAAQLDRHGTTEEQMVAAVKFALGSLGLKYIDSVLLKPYPDYWQTIQAWRILEEAVEQGVVRQLGLASIDSLDQLRMVYREARFKPAVVFQSSAKGKDLFQGNQSEIRDWCTGMGIYVQQTGTLSQHKVVIDHPTMKDLAAKYSVTPSVLFARFAMGEGVVPLSGTEAAERMKEDVSAWRVPLSEQDAEVIDALLKEVYELQPGSSLSEDEQEKKVAEALSALR